MNARRLSAVVVGSAALSVSSVAQVPDLLTAFDAGGRALGMGSSVNATSADTLSTYYNPAGLGYLNQNQFGAAYRNLPRSHTALSGDFSDPRLDSTGTRGKNALTHLGFAFPLRGGANGTIGVSYTVGGYMDDTRTGNGLPSGNLTVQNYREEAEAKSDFYTLSWGKANSSQTMAWGLGVQFVQQHISDNVTGRLVDQNNQTVSLLDSRSDETANGVGIIAGVQFVPKSNPNVSFGLSYRSEINLQNNPDTAGLYDKIPARLIGGVAMRQDGLRGGRDFIVWGAQVQHFFAGGSSPLFDRDPQTTIGVGLEYNYQSANYRIPVRLGYNVIPKGGSGFGSRDGFTFGVGYRPLDSRFGIDLNFVSPQRGGYDMALSVNYKFGS
jgi:hypothetical protein